VLALTSWLVLSNLVFCYGYMLARQLHSPSAAVTLQLGFKWSTHIGGRNLAGNHLCCLPIINAGYFDGNHPFALNEWLKNFVVSISCFTL
jgi:hypothetical protein